VKRAYSQTEVATLLGVDVAQAQSLSHLVHGEVRDLYDFQDLVLLRSAHGLVTRKVSKAKIAAALARLKAQLPTNQPLSAVSFDAAGAELVVGVGDARWNAESGQQVFDFRGTAKGGAAMLRPTGADAELLFRQGVNLEEHSPGEAVEKYLECVAANPRHADAHVNLGRLLHTSHRLREAEAHYVAALVARSGDATATFNLAVVLEDQGRTEDAIARYQDAIALEPSNVDAYFNLARLYEKKGEKMAALRHLKDYRRLRGGR